METLSFNGYHGSIETEVADNVLHGKILFISDLVTYEAETLAQLQIGFQAAVQDYIETCQAIGKTPQKSLTGQFNVRVGEDLHKRASIRALTDNKTLNGVVVGALEAYLHQGAPVLNHVHTHQHRVTVTIDKQDLAWSTPSSDLQFTKSSTATHDTSSTRH